MSAEQHSHTGWYEALARKAKAEELTLMETMALCLHNIQNHIVFQAEHVRDSSQAMQHVEGMVGAIDEMFSRLDPGYAASGKVREALDAKRDADRAKALPDAEVD